MESVELDYGILDNLSVELDDNCFLMVDSMVGQGTNSSVL
jgi:hypothetical protein